MKNRLRFTANLLRSIFCLSGNSDHVRPIEIESFVRNGRAQCIELTDPRSVCNEIEYFFTVNKESADGVSQYHTSARAIKAIVIHGSLSFLNIE